MSYTFGNSLILNTGWAGGKVDTLPARQELGQKPLNDNVLTTLRGAFKHGWYIGLAFRFIDREKGFKGAFETSTKQEATPEEPPAEESPGETAKPEPGTETKPTPETPAPAGFPVDVVGTYRAADGRVVEVRQSGSSLQIVLPKEPAASLTSTGNDNFTVATDATRKVQFQREAERRESSSSSNSQRSAAAARRAPVRTWEPEHGADRLRSTGPTTITMVLGRRLGEHLTAL